MTQRVKKSIDKNFHETLEIKQKNLIAKLVMSEFNAFYERYKEITESAKKAFENCDFQES